MPQLPEFIGKIPHHSGESHHRRARRRDANKYAAYYNTKVNRILSCATTQDEFDRRAKQCEEIFAVYMDLHDRYYYGHE